MLSSIADAIVKSLESEGIEYAFGISGSHYLAFFKALKNSSIKYISVKHESAAGFMALHYARFAQKPALIMGTAGPGATNLITGIAELYKANLPCFVLTPIVPTHLQGKNSFQEDSGLGNSYSIADLMKCVTKKSIMCVHPENIVANIQDLFRSSFHGRKGPVHLLVPTNFFETKFNFTPAPPFQYRIVNDRSFDPAGVSSIAKAIATSKRPLLFVGHRAWFPNTSGAIARLSNEFGIPVVLSASAKGLYDEYSPFFGGILDLFGHRSAEVLIKQSDLIISVGEDFGESSTNKYDNDFFTGKLIQLDIDGLDIGRNYPAIYSACGHLESILDAIAFELKQCHPGHFYENISSLFLKENAVLLEESVDESMPLKPQRILKEISDSIPQGSIIIADIGANGYFTLRNLKVRNSGYSVSMQNYSMGQGMAGSLGAKLSMPENIVITICGDGSFLMNGMEIATACQNNIPIIWIIFVDKKYGFIEWSQRLFYNELSYCTELNVPDLAKMADAFAIDFYQIADLPSLKSNLPSAIKKYQSENRSALIEIIYDGKYPLPMKPQLVKFIQDMGDVAETAKSPYLMKAFKRMLREKV